ncbi:hypothetical protein M5X00_32315 [Paenibacillus alvei]|uniref:hypothetical protein n=1 Tax=Paenibacillus alvei TaxID=44250 RepID=UPI0021D2D66A|nr:hypothetical protein [Paenibacillus alvei]MCY9544583.1 hypothetical protein [Paenibacillus alvei]MCY9707449.1 hypothetical protein [Paenibacillus alvei]MCY9758904.1 hypothetical protein [Paenibacillus alvei]MEC0084381.1 hypothetical protein [Paenibacillus alvei]
MKEQTKQVSKKIIKALQSSFVKSGTMVANDKKNENNSMYYMTTLDLQTKHEITDINMAKEILKTLCNKYVWSFSSVHASKFNTSIDRVDINVHFIHAEHDSKQKTLNCSFYISGVSNIDATNKVKTIIKHATLDFNLLGVTEYFKIDDCFIVNVEIPLSINSIDEIRDVLIRFCSDWRVTGLEAFSEECVLDDNITSLSVWFKEAKL